MELEYKLCKERRQLHWNGERREKRSLASPSQGVVLEEPHVSLMEALEVTLAFTWQWNWTACPFYTADPTCFQQWYPKMYFALASVQMQ